MIDIRLMTERDIAQVAVIEKEIFSVPWSEQSFFESINSENTLFVVAQKDNNIVGYCGMYISFEEGNITNVAVSSKNRRQGVGSKLLGYLLKSAIQKGVKDVVLEVRESNATAVSLYKKIGFEKAGIRKNFYEKPVENALIMWKHNL